MPALCIGPAHERQPAFRADLGSFAAREGHGGILWAATRNRRPHAEATVRHEDSVCDAAAAGVRVRLLLSADAYGCTGRLVQ